MAPSSKKTDKEVGERPPLKAAQDVCDWALGKAEDFVDDVQHEAWTLAMEAFADRGDLTPLAMFFRLGKPIKPRIANILARILLRGSCPRNCPAQCRCRNICPVSV